MTVWAQGDCLHEAEGGPYMNMAVFLEAWLDSAGPGVRTGKGYPALEVGMPHRDGY